MRGCVIAQRSPYIYAQARGLFVLVKGTAEVVRPDPDASRPHSAEGDAEEEEESNRQREGEKWEVAGCRLRLFSSNRTTYCPNRSI